MSNDTRNIWSLDNGLQWRAAIVICMKLEFFQQSKAAQETA